MERLIAKLSAELPSELRRVCREVDDTAWKLRGMESGSLLGRLFNRLYTLQRIVELLLKLCNELVQLRRYVSAAGLMPEYYRWVKR